MMSIINSKCMIFIRIFFVFALYISTFSSHADESIGASIDCSDVSINYTDNPDLSQSERIEAMNNAFYDALNRFELCHLSTEASSSSQAASDSEQGTGMEAGASMEGTGDAESNSSMESAEAMQEGDGAYESVSSATMTGTEVQSTIPPGNVESAIEDSVNIDETAVAVYTNSNPNGARPQDIPDANNDDAVASQIRLAAEIETDPVKKEKLWNEYRKYKGLPVK
jgi:hypothetical protein